MLDGSSNRVKMAAPVECKGIVGSDDRYTFEILLFCFTHLLLACNMYFLFWNLYFYVSEYVLTLFKHLQTLSARFNENDCKGCKLRRSRVTLLCLKA